MDAIIELLLYLLTVRLFQDQILKIREIYH